jgi:NADH-quinone oxidoreductase subunit C
MISEELKQRPAVAALLERYPTAILEAGDQGGETSLFADPSQIVALCAFLKGEQQFTRLSGITAVDWYPGDPRFELVYLLHSIPRRERLRIKCRLGEDAAEID